MGVTFFALLLQTMFINGHNVTPPLAAVTNIPSCMVCLQYRLHPNETDLEARKRMFAAWAKQDELVTQNNSKYFLKLIYVDSKGNCNAPRKTKTYKKKQDFPLVDAPVPGCRNVWFVKWEKVP